VGGSNGREARLLFVLVLWKEAGWGWALRDFRGSFGVLDSDRADARYETFHGHKLDRLPFPCNLLPLPSILLSDGT
jgi:hypothetical protein